MTDITIPPEAVKALRDELTACDCDECVSNMIRAAIKAWPGACREQDQLGGNWHRIILPLPPKESSDD